MSNYTIESLLRKAVELKASDLHLIVGEAPALRIDGKILKTTLSVVTPEIMAEIINTITPFSMKDKIMNSYDSDFPYEIEGVARFRVNVGMSLGYNVVTIRIIPFEIPDFKSLELPDCIEKFTYFENGIIFVTGVAGSGKSTTIASLINYINNHHKKHIITIEDPVEYVYKSYKSIFTQRQIGIDTATYIDGVKYALRQDPDIILIGEIRDKETMEIALHAAETGHLVLTTMHTFNAIQTIDRVLSFFDPEETEYVRKQLAEIFKGTISQKLLPKKSGTGRIPAFEILFSTPTIKDFIIKNELNEIYKLVQKGGYNDMITFNQSLYNLYKQGSISQETALENSDSKNELIHYMRGVYTGSEGL